MNRYDNGRFGLLYILLIGSLIFTQHPAYSQGETLTVFWKANAEKDVLSYKVYCGTRPSNYDRIEWVSGRTSQLFADLSEGQRYYFAVSAVDFWGNESQLSREVSGVVGDVVLPLYTSMADNYPNPFNSETIIEINLPHDMLITVKVFNALGQEIKVLAKEHYPAGKSFVFWNGQDGEGNPVASGNYFYQLDSGADVITRQMMLVR